MIAYFFRLYSIFDICLSPSKTLSSIINSSNGSEIYVKLASLPYFANLYYLLIYIMS